MNYKVVFVNHSSFDLKSYKKMLMVDYADQCWDIFLDSGASTLKIVIRDDQPQLAGKIKMDIDIEEVCVICNVFLDERYYQQLLCKLND